MDEKLGISKIAKCSHLCKIMHILHFCLGKEVKNLFYAGFSTKYELCIPSED